MITAQDIREKTFEKSTFGGYAMNEVDDFLDEMANDLAGSQKELATMRAKMKVLVEKIEEYRGAEDDMHKALLTAQKTSRTIEEEAQAKAEAIIAEAQEKADAILADAQAQADAITGNLGQLRAAEELRLQKAQFAAADFVQTAMTKLSATLSSLQELQDADLTGVVVTPAPAARKAIAAPADEEYAAEEEPVVEEEPVAEEPAEEEEFTEEPLFEEKAPNATGEPDYFKAFEEAVFKADEAAEEEVDEPLFTL